MIKSFQRFFILFFTYVMFVHACVYTSQCLVCFLIKTFPPFTVHLYSELCANTLQGLASGLCGVCMSVYVDRMAEWTLMNLRSCFQAFEKQNSGHEDKSTSITSFIHWQIIAYLVNCLCHTYLSTIYFFLQQCVCVRMRPHEPTIHPKIPKHGYGKREYIYEEGCCTGCLRQELLYVFLPQFYSAVERTLNYSE